MKKIIFALIFISIILPAFSQNNSAIDTGNSGIYYVNVPIEGIYITGLGYIIMYRKGGNQIGTVSIPNEWFVESAGRAEMMRLPTGADWPTMSIFYKDGEFSHIRIYVHRSRGHRTWRMWPGTADERPYFTDTENFNIQF